MYTSCFLLFFYVYLFLFIYFFFPFYLYLTKSSFQVVCFKVKHYFSCVNIVVPPPPLPVLILVSDN